MSVIEQYTRAHVLTASHEDQGRVPAVLRHEPGASEVTIRLAAPTAREWRVDRALLERGVCSPAHGDGAGKQQRPPGLAGSVRVWPCGRAGTVVELPGDEGVVVAQFDTTVLLRFLGRIHAAATGAPTPTPTGAAGAAAGAARTAAPARAAAGAAGFAAPARAAAGAAATPTATPVPAGAAPATPGATTGAAPVPTGAARAATGAARVTPAPASATSAAAGTAATAATATRGAAPATTGAAPVPTGAAPDSGTPAVAAPTDRP
ncbi:hypothetical protein [Streptomyces sp. NPDC002640]